MKVVTMAVLSLFFLFAENLIYAQINEFKLTASDGTAQPQSLLTVQILSL